MQSEKGVDLTVLRPLHLSRLGSDLLWQIGLWLVEQYGVLYLVTHLHNMLVILLKRLLLYYIPFI